jgi:hypothetical protein
MTVAPATLVAICLVWFLASSLTIYPHSLSYFNESIGGPRNGPKHLLGSNVDWGQDIQFLKSLDLPASTQSPVYIAYYGSVEPSSVGLANYRRSKFGTSKAGLANASDINVIQGGTYVVSVNFIYGMRGIVYGGGGSWGSAESSRLRRFSKFVPMRMVGYSIAIFAMTE